MGAKALVEVQTLPWTVPVTAAPSRSIPVTERSLPAVAVSMSGSCQETLPWCVRLTVTTGAGAGRLTATATVLLGRFRANAVPAPATTAMLSRPASNRPWPIRVVLTGVSSRTLIANGTYEGTSMYQGDRRRKTGSGSQVFGVLRRSDRSAAVPEATCARLDA